MDCVRLWSVSSHSSTHWHIEHILSVLLAWKCILSIYYCKVIPLSYVTDRRKIHFFLRKIRSCNDSIVGYTMSTSLGVGVYVLLYQPQFNSQDRLHQSSPLPSAEEMLQLRRKFSSSTSITAADSTTQLQQQGLGLGFGLGLGSCDDDDVTDDTRQTCRRESVASCSSSRSVSFLRLRSHSLRYWHYCRKFAGKTDGTLPDTERAERRVSHDM